jgi:hypothetical protein
MALATLSVDFEAKLAKLEQGFDRASRLSEKFAADQERRFAAVKGAATAIGSALAGAFSVTQIAQFARATVDGLDALNDLKDATGASVENISALEDVAARTGTSFESMASTLVKFNKELSDAKGGSEGANIFKNLGLSVEELRKQDPAEALRQTAVALSAFSDEGNKARYIQALFGKSVQEAAPFLKDLAEQGRLNATVTAQQAQAAEDFNKQLFELEKNAKDTGRAFVNELLPALNRFFKETKEAESGLERLAAFLRGTGFGSGLKLIGVDIFGKDQQDQVANLQRDLDATNKLLEAGNLSEERRLRLLERRRILEADIAQMRITLPEADYSNEGRTRPRPVLGALPDADKKAKKEKDPLRGPVIPVDILDERNRLEREFQALLDRTPTAKLEKQRDAQVMLAKAYEDGRFGIVGSQVALDKYIEAAQSALPDAVETALVELERMADESSEFFAEAARNIQDTMGDTLKRSLKGDFDDIKDAWKNMLFDLVAQAAAAKLNQALFGSDFGKTGQLGGALGNLFGTGGTYPTGGMYEGSYTVPSFGGQSASGGRMSAMSARQSVVIDNSGQTINVGADVSRAEVEKAIATANARTEERLRRSMRQGTYT